MQVSLEILYEPRDHKPAANIVFIPGLSGDAKSTWTHEATTTFWPKDLLPKIFPQFRVLSYGYSADLMDFFPRAGAPHESIDNHSARLIESLIDLRADPSKAEGQIFFVAHSLGGLLCANALMHDRAEERNIRRDTAAIFFFATPFADPGCLDLWADTVDNFFRLFGTGNDDLEDLDPVEQTEKARSIIEGFVGFLRDEDRIRPRSSIRLVFFAEDDPMKTGNAAGTKILEEDMAALQEFPSITIEGDHVSMCKFNSRSPGLLRFYHELEDAGQLSFSRYLVKVSRVAEFPDTGYTYTTMRCTD